MQFVRQAQVWPVGVGEHEYCAQEDCEWYSEWVLVSAGDAPPDHNEERVVLHLKWNRPEDTNVAAEHIVARDASDAFYP